MYFEQRIYNIFENYLKMALEATLIMLDNSACALNGDYLPTRWESQVDAASLLINGKLESNLQSSVGLGLMGGRQVEVLCTMTSDSNKVSSYLFGVKIHGSLHFTQALQIGALALKHRSNETQKQRLVCFIGSTIVEDSDTLKIFGKKLKKNGVAVDLICFGDCSAEQLNKIQVFKTAVQQDDNCHTLIIEPGEVYISEKLLGSDILNMGGGGAMMGGPGNMEVEDPELAEAIRMSLQESMPAQQVQPQGDVQGGGDREPTEEELQALAIRLSLEEANNANQGEKKEEEDQQKKE